MIPPLEAQYAGIFANAIRPNDDDVLTMEPPPLASAFPAQTWPPGEGAARAQLLQAVEQLLALHFPPTMDGPRNELPNAVVVL